MTQSSDSVPENHRESQRQSILERRTLPRFSVDGEVTAHFESLDRVVKGRSFDLSWGGVCIRVPDRVFQRNDSIIIRLPMPHTNGYSAKGQVSWRHQVDDRNSLVGVEFSSLTIRDHGTLEQVLSILARPQLTPNHDNPFPDDVELLFLDQKEILNFLKQVRHGVVQTCLFRSFAAGQPVRLIVNGFGDFPQLLLRARINWQRSFNYTNDVASSGLFDSNITIEHPSDDLNQLFDNALGFTQAYSRGDSSVQRPRAVRPHAGYIARAPRTPNAGPLWRQTAKNQNRPPPTR